MAIINEQIATFYDPSSIIWYVKGSKRTCVCTEHLPKEYKIVLYKNVSNQISRIQENVKQKLEDDDQAYISKYWLSNFCRESNRISSISTEECFILGETKEHDYREKYVNVNHLDYYFEDGPVPLVRQKCDVCRIQKGIAKISNIFETSYKRRVIDKMWRFWATPRQDGTCPYAEWSWKKMQQELVV